MKIIKSQSKSSRTTTRRDKFKVHVIDIKNQSFYVKQDFKEVDDRIPDSKGRIIISNSWVPKPVRSFKIYRNGDGDLLLRPEVLIPAREAWIFQNPEVLASLQRGIQDAKEGKGDIVDDVDSYLKKL